MTYGNHQVANNLSVANSKPDEFRGDPSLVTNQVSLPGGFQLNRETLELRCETNVVLERTPAFVDLIARDFFGAERRGTATSVGPFATTPAQGSALRLRRDPVSRPH